MKSEKSGEGWILNDKLERYLNKLGISSYYKSSGKVSTDISCKIDYKSLMSGELQTEDKDDVEKFEDNLIYEEEVLENYCNNKLGVSSMGRKMKGVLKNLPCKTDYKSLMSGEQKKED